MGVPDSGAAADPVRDGHAKPSLAIASVAPCPVCPLARTTITTTIMDLTAFR